MYSTKGGDTFCLIQTSVNMVVYDFRKLPSLDLPMIWCSISYCL